jgi:hypothetical protein
MSENAVLADFARMQAVLLPWRHGRLMSAHGRRHCARHLFLVLSTASFARLLRAVLGNVILRPRTSLFSRFHSASGRVLALSDGACA